MQIDLITLADYIARVILLRNGTKDYAEKTESNANKFHRPTSIFHYNSMVNVFFKRKQQLFYKKVNHRSSSDITPRK